MENACGTVPFPRLAAGAWLRHARAADSRPYDAPRPRVRQSFLSFTFLLPVAGQVQQTVDRSKSLMEVPQSLPPPRKAVPLGKVAANVVSRRKGSAPERAKAHTLGDCSFRTDRRALCSTDALLLCKIG